MRKFMLAICIISIHTACNNKPSTPTPLETDMVVLTPGNRIKVYYDQQPDTITSVRIGTSQQEPTIKQVVSFTNKLIPGNINVDGPVVQENIRTASVPVKKVEPIPAGNSANTNTTTNTAGIIYPAIENDDTMNTQVATQVAVVKEKNVWSNATKGAVVGGVGGAIGGAIISKKKGKGAIIGGIIGATGGYIFGKNRDKKQESDN